MNTNIKVLSLFLSVIMLLSFLFSCSGQLEENDGYSESASVAETSLATDEFDDKFPILKDGKYIVKAVMPDSPTEAEKSVYTKLRSALNTKTKVKIDSNTDYLKTGEFHNNDEYVILVGKTNYKESEWIYGKTKADTYGMQIVGKNKLLIYFSTESEGFQLVENLISAINSDKSGYFWINGGFSVTKTTKFKLETIPAYSSSTSSYDCGDDTTMLLAKNTNISSYEKYCNELIANGYTEYSKRDNVNGNCYRIYTKGTMALNVYFTKSASTVRIISGPLDDIPTNEVDKTPEKNKDVSVTMLSQGENTDCGLGLIFHLANGKFIIFDGGFSLSDKLYSKLVEIAPKGSKIIITAWFISHPHNDHQEAVTNFIKRHASDVEVENVFYNYAPSSFYTNASNETNTAGIETVADGLEGLLNSNFDRTTKIIKPHTGQIYNFGSASAEILYTVEDVLEKKLDYVNTSSLIVRFKIGDQTILALADATHTISTILQNTYGTYLKSDIVQLAHHGTYPGHASLYTKINASVLLWPSNTENAKKQYSDSAVKEALAKAKDVYLAKDVDVTLKLPYSVKNNKNDFLKSIGKK